MVNYLYRMNRGRNTGRRIVMSIKELLDRIDKLDEGLSAEVEELVAKYDRLYDHADILADQLGTDLPRHFRLKTE